MYHNTDKNLNVEYKKIFQETDTLELKEIANKINETCDILK